MANELYKKKEAIQKIVKNFFIKIEKQPQWLLPAAVIGVIFIGLVLGYYLAEKNITKSNIEPPEEMEVTTGQDDNLARRSIDGLLVEAAEADKYYPIAVMIENHWEARPASGLAKANLVFEAITEGGITRFLAFYEGGGEEISQVGPVRSARPYYLDWVSELDALYMHVGGSNEALRKIKQYRLKDLNEYYYGEYYWRANSRPRPHNVYTSGELVAKALELKNLAAVRPNFEAWIYKDDLAEEQRTENAKIIIDYGSEIFKVKWQYDKKNNEYIRYLDGQPHQDSDGSQIKAKNIAVAYMKMWVLDEIGRKRFETIGEGKAIVFRDGQAIEGVWRKKNRVSRTRFYNQEGKEIEFNAGATWVEIVPNGYGVEY